MSTNIVFFGCWGDAGHFLWNPDKSWVSDRDVRRLSLPTAGDLDGSDLFLPRPEVIGHGAMTYLPAPNLTVLAWWGGSPWDSRPNVNNAIITTGEFNDLVLWNLFTRYFEELAGLMKRPDVVKKA